MQNTREIQDWLIARIAELLDIKQGDIDVRGPFSSYGLSSLDAVALSGEMEDFIGRRLSPTIIFDYPNILTLSNYLSQSTKEEISPSVNNGITNYNEPIAIIGMSCRLPGANNPEAFWQLLHDGVDMIKEVPENRWPKKAFYHPDPAMPGKSVSYWGGFLDHVDQFDPYFFGISPIEAKHMDPQQRLLLELSYEAFDDAGQIRENIDGSDTGVFIGISVNEYSQLEWIDPSQINSHSGTGNALSIAANRISYIFNLRGPSMAIDTACSSSLAAIHLACQSLKKSECNMAVSGGVNIILSPAHSVAFTKAGVLAPDGRCKSFDAEANGYVRGEGGGVVILKRLSSAIKDGDTIHALILGSAMKQDGRTNGLIAPSSEGQEALLRETYKAADISPCSVQYVETHGTGTILGDSMEAKALGNILSVDRGNGYCSIGSVKTNIGHLEAAAGVAGLIKVILSMKHRALPSSLHYHSPNPYIAFDQLKLKVNSELSSWPPHPEPMLAGISSFGFGGTNVHMVVREAGNTNNDGKNDQRTISTRRETYLLPLSANTPEALRSTASDLLKLLEPDSTFAAFDICFAAGLRRSQFNSRLAVFGNSKNELSGSLQSYLEGEQHPNIFLSNENNYHQPKLAFVFSGQGGQWLGMGRELLKTEPVFYKAIIKIDQLIQQNFSWSLIEELNKDLSQSQLNEISVVQPAIFAIQVALAELWKSWGIIPDAVAGHSMGEVAAAHVAGILSLEEAIKIICSRSELLKTLSGKGSMIVTELSLDQAKEVVKKYGNDIAIGVINSPTSIVLSGSKETMNEIMDLMQQQNLFCKRVNVDVASHSPQIDLLRTEMLEKLEGIHSCVPNIPFYSTVTGGRAHDIIFDAQYWFDNLRKPVLFSDTISQLLDSGYSIFIEVGPHPVLLSSIQQSLKPHHQQISLLPCLRRDEPEQEIMFKALSTLYTNGFEISWKNLYPGGKKNIPLPPIPWQRQRYWLDIKISSSIDPWHRDQPAYKKPHPLLGERIDIANSSSFIWQTVLDSETLVFLNDHRVGNEIVFPAAAYIEMALQAANEIGVNISHELFDFDFREPMILHNGKQKTVQGLLTEDKENNFLFSVYSRSDSNKNWILHALASFIKKENIDPATSVITRFDKIRSRIGPEYSADELYQKLQSRGIHYGRSFRSIQQLCSKEDEALAQVTLPDTLEYDAGFYQIHPAFLDGCLQVIAAIQTGAPGNDLYLPVGCKQIRFHSKPEPVLWSHVSLRSDTSQEQDVISADIIVSDNNGNVVAELIDFRLQRTRRVIRQGFLQRDIWMYQLQWQMKEDSTSSLISQKQKHWLIFADGSGLADEIKKQFELNGDHCHLLSYKEIFKNSEDDLARKTEDLINKISSPLYGVIHLWGTVASTFGEGSPGNPIATSLENCSRVLYLVQALSKRLAKMPRLWLITKGAQPVINGEMLVPEQSTLWGLGKTIGFEIPDLTCVRIDLDPLQQTVEDAQQVFKQISREDHEDQVAFRKGVRYVQRLLPFTLNTSLASAPLSLRTDRSYMITGGMGGLGLETAKWMINLGAKHLILLGRNTPSPSAMNVIDQMRNKGIEVFIAQADVSDPIQLKTVFDNIGKQMVALSGVIHAAGVLDDGSLLNLNAERMEKVMAPKLNGTWNLHNETLNLHLDFFVLFSSAVSVLGSPGQANYAAASSYLDAMAHLRHNMGLPAISINWGPWAEVGLAAEATEKLNAQNVSAQHLVKVIDIDRGFEVLEQLLMESIAQVMTLPFDLKNLIELYPTAAAMPFLSEVRGNEAHIARRYARPNLRQQYIAPRNELEHKLAELWKQTLHIDNVGVHDSFFELGGDSILAAQILALAQKTFGIRINPQDAFKAFTIEKLAEILEVEIINKIEQMTEEEAEERLSSEN